MAVFAILSSNPEVRRKNNLNLHIVYNNVPGIHAVQITIRDSEDMAAARIDVSSSVQIIDISMSYLAKEVSRKLAGSASLQYSDLVK
jgi:tRNA-dihydrouridine synthase